MLHKIKMVNMFTWMVSGIFLLFCSYINFSFLYGDWDIPQEEIRPHYFLLISLGIIGVINLIYGGIQIIELRNKFMMKELGVIKTSTYLYYSCNILACAFILRQGYSHKIKLVFCMFCLIPVFIDAFVKFLERYKVKEYN